MSTARLPLTVRDAGVDNTCLLAICITARHVRRRIAEAAGENTIAVGYGADFPASVARAAVGSTSGDAGC